MLRLRSQYDDAIDGATIYCMLPRRAKWKKGDLEVMSKEDSRHHGLVHGSLGRSQQPSQRDKFHHPSSIRLLLKCEHCCATPSDTLGRSLIWVLTTKSSGSALNAVSGIVQDAQPAFSPVFTLINSTRGSTALVTPLGGRVERPSWLTLFEEGGDKVIAKRMQTAWLSQVVSKHSQMEQDAPNATSGREGMRICCLPLAFGVG